MEVVQTWTRGWINFVQTFDGFLHVVSYRCQGCHDGGGTEAVSDHGEVSEVPLDAGLQDGLRVGVAEGRPVLVEEVHQLLADQIGLEDELFPSVDL